MNNIDKFFKKDPVYFAKSYLEYLGGIIENINHKDIGRFIEILIKARDCGATVFFIGNGGSAATASHFANDLSVGTNSYKKPFRAMSLTDNHSIITAIANDFGYNEVFSRQLRIHGKECDILVAISASGNSPNLINAFNEAKSMGIHTVAITGFDGGKMKQIADDGIHVQTDLKEYGPAEDIHMILDHLVGAYLMRYVKNEDLSE